MTTSNDTTPQKHCPKCGQDKPQTREFFALNKTKRDGWDTCCKACKAEYSRNRYQTKPEVRERERKYQLEHREERRQQRVKHSRTDKFRAMKRESQRRYQEDPEVKARGLVHDSKYRSRIRLLPKTFTKQDWQRCLEYFNGCCAVCGRPLKDLFSTHWASKDHWIPLSHPDCPGTVATNIVPLCHGIDGCNNRKSSIHPTEWLLRVFGKHKSDIILQRINDYFERAKRQT